PSCWFSPPYECPIVEHSLKDLSVFAHTIDGRPKNDFVDRALSRTESDDVELNVLRARNTTPTCTVCESAIPCVCSTQIEKQQATSVYAFPAPAPRPSLRQRFFWTKPRTYSISMLDGRPQPIRLEKTRFGPAGRCARVGVTSAHSCRSAASGFIPTARHAGRAIDVSAMRMVSAIAAV